MAVLRMDNVGIVVDDLEADVYLLCYVRAPEGFMVGLAQPLGEGG